ncbi:polyhydroxyalkanoate synthase [Bradyrhizobium elkanii]|uniref:Alpha/beta fold hydrolase n=1 Tax=Bradyrhizobium brasilense TaxID=1419277 RepID=A0ABY8JPA3_9BRAD|nr:alpha/beta fold hydrolase [Bradyrhizobium brasilense]MCP1913846.1 polyhydroxyalkanoate synthase [Bradyrhizobium elkanii]WFU66211.1 alpha/beta fold hydrolase [Bradyrhizobium brasilense]
MTVQAVLDQPTSPANDDVTGARTVASVPSESEPLTAAESIDQLVHAAMARWTGGLSPASLALAFADWQLHLAASPGKRLQLALNAVAEGSRFARMVSTPHAAWQPWFMVKPQPGDNRFAGQDWTLPAFNVVAQAFLLGEQWWHSATSGLRGVSKGNSAIVDFTVRQCLDVVAPSNFAFSNPEVLRRAMDSGGGNFVSGWHNWLEDCRDLLSGKPSEPPLFVVGKDVATTKGKVVYRNELIELIQYAPATTDVCPEPVLIVPAWIMKYYILDLSPENSLVRFLVERGFTVFMISWRNPGPADRDLGIEDYRKLGIDAAIDVINQLAPERAIHAAGYCLGGTLLAIAAARLQRERPGCLRSVTLLAAQVDFTDAGELTLFINESQIAFLEDMMRQRGVLETAQMAGAFQLLRSNDVIWSRLVRDYLMGDRAAPSDLMSWNADATRMPYRMHSDYLRKLFLNNDLAEGRYLADWQPMALSDLRAPMFVVGTVRDHVAPWRSVHKIHLLADADIAFVLASGGHSAGIVAPPSEEGHSYQLLEKKADQPYVGPDEWLRKAVNRDGSWWLEWVRFLTAYSGTWEPAKTSLHAPQSGPPLDDAPGQYVLQH